MNRKILTILAATALTSSLSACVANGVGLGGALDAKEPRARFIDGNGQPIVSDYPHTVYGATEAFKGVGLNAEAAKAVHVALDTVLSSYNDEKAYGAAVKVANCPGVGTGGYGVKWQGGGAEGTAYACFTGSLTVREIVVAGGGKRVNAFVVRDVATQTTSVWNIDPK